MNEIEVDFSKEIKASMAINCDACGKTLGESYPRGRETIQITLKDGEDDDGYDKWKTFHACDEECLRNLLNKRGGGEVEDE